ncbi:tetratricopeptide repeat protein [Pseudodesulfovibrio sp.]|nr:tetratricopeptide repeat protein [Pseudodesulfovibrio sp.]
MTDKAQRTQEDILAAVKEVEKEAAGGAEALLMAAMLAETPLPYDFALSIEGTPHNPSLINPAAAFFAATATIDPLVTRDLIKIDADDQIYQLHDDVRETLRTSMSTEKKIEWAGRAIYALNLVLPDAEPQHWHTVEWLMPHILACRDLVLELEVHTAAANRVLHQAGFSLYHQQRYREAAELLDIALTVDVGLKGKQHPDISIDLEGLGSVLWAGGDYLRAEAAFAGCYELQKEIYTEDNLVTAPILNSLAVVRQSLGKFDEAEETFKECLRVLTSAHGEGHPSIASCLSNMALLYEAMGRPEDALNLAERSLEINRTTFGDAHPEVAADLNTVALLNDALGNAEAAEKHFRDSLGVREEVYGKDHPETAQSLCNLALFLDNADQDAEAVQLYEKGLAAYEASLGPSHPLMESALDNYIMLLEKTGGRPASDTLRELTEAKLRQIVERAK